MKRRPAFTFLELLIALSLFSVGMISILQIFPLNRRYLAQSSFLTQATYLGQEQLETLQGVAYVDLTVGTFEARHALGDSAAPGLSQFERQTVVSLINSSYNATATDIGLKKVETTVFWVERSGNRQYQLVTYVSN